MERAPGTTKFRAMIIGLCFLLAGYVLAGWRGWGNMFGEYAWGVFGLTIAFMVPNVAEHFASRWTPKSKS
jgi:hypothetical protein